MTGDRPVNLTLSGPEVARRRVRRFTDPRDRERFIEAFRRARQATLRDDQMLYHWYRAALNGNDSVTVAGYIEGAASARDKEGLIL